MRVRPPFVFALAFAVSALVLSIGGLGCDAEPIEDAALRGADQCPDLETELSILAAHERQAEIWACRVECSHDMLDCIEAGGCIDCTEQRWSCMESCIAPEPGIAALPYHCEDVGQPEPLCYCNADGLLCDHDGFASCDACPL